MRKGSRGPNEALMGGDNNEASELYCCHLGDGVVTGGVMINVCLSVQNHYAWSLTPYVYILAQISLDWGPIILDHIKRKSKSFQPLHQY